MKRLLAYLFIVFGLGLTFSVNADAKDYYCINKKVNTNNPDITYNEIKSLINQYESPIIVVNQYYLKFNKYQKEERIITCGNKKNLILDISQKKNMKKD